MTYVLAESNGWHEFWQSNIGHWILHKGIKIVVLIVISMVAVRVIGWLSRRITRRLGRHESDALLRSEATKHRQAVASVLSWIAIAVLCILVSVEILGTLGLPIGSLVAPAAVLGGALGFGAQRIVQDLLSGFFIIIEKQYGFGDLVQLTVSGVSKESIGTVEDVTLRVTKLRNSDGEVFTIPNGQIVRSNNLSKDWARAVIDIPVPVTEDLNEVNDILHRISNTAVDDNQLSTLLLDKPALMGVESIQVDIINVRMVARTLPGKQFEVGRRLRSLVVTGLRRAGIDSSAPSVANPDVPVPEPSNR